MNTRSTRSTLTFYAPFAVSGCPGELPAGDYEVLVEEERLWGLGFEAWRRTATHLVVRGRRGRAGRTELRAISQFELNAALSRDRSVVEEVGRSAPRAGGTALRSVPKLESIRSIHAKTPAGTTDDRLKRVKAACTRATAGPGRDAAMAHCEAAETASASRNDSECNRELDAAGRALV